MQDYSTYPSKYEQKKEDSQTWREGHLYMAPKSLSILAPAFHTTLSDASLLLALCDLTTGPFSELLKHIKFFLD